MKKKTLTKKQQSALKAAQKVVGKGPTLSSQEKKMVDQMYAAYNTSLTKATNKAIAATENAINKLGEKYQELYDAVIAKRTAFFEKLSDYGELYTADEYGYMSLKNFKAATAQINRYSKNVEQLKKTLPDGLMEEILGLDTASGLQLTNQLLKMNEKELKAWGKDYTKFMNAATTTSKNYYQPQLDKIKKDFDVAVSAKWKALDKQLETIGKNAIQGFIAGMNKKLKNLTGASKKLALAVRNEFKRALKIHSPSRVMAGLGRYTGQGFLNGLVDMGSKVDDTLNRMLTIPDVRMPDIQVPALSYAGPGGLDGDVNFLGGAEYVIIVPVDLDGKEIARVTAPYTQAELNKRQTRENRKRGKT